MFDYLFKKPTETDAMPGATQKTSNKPSDQSDAQIAARRDKEQALQQAQALSAEELQAVEFILSCQFADARLIAAQHVHTKPMLERVLPAMRNADRRVAKLIQGRLDALVAEQQGREQAQICIEQAQRLSEEAHLLPNQVVDLDHAWKLVKAPQESLQAAFDAVRAILRDKLEKQADLQHQIIHRTAMLRDLSLRAADMDEQELTTILDQVEQEVAQYLAAPEAAALPKNLLSDFSAQHRQCKTLLASLGETKLALQAREALLATWEQERPTLKLDSVRAQWQAAPALPLGAPGEAALQLRFEALVHELTEMQKSSRQEAKTAREASQAASQAARTQLGETLDAIEKALREGAVRTALDLEKQVRAQEAQKIRISADDAAHLARLRGELKSLQGWAKWGGNISREELLKAAEDLAGKTIPVTELAKKVGGLREHWKSLDVSAGPAGKEMWERFDAACTTAYAPAAAHFKKLSDERHANQKAAETLLGEVRQYAQAADAQAEARDWKAIAAFCTRTEQAWHRIGVIERKEKKRLDQEFKQAMQALREPLSAQQGQEAQVRKDLIAEVEALNAADRSTLDKVKALQERWQQRAKALPLERKQEQALWQQFRAACDGLFARRKEFAAGADAERKQHMADKEALCAALEAAEGDTVAAISKLLREAKEQWSKIGQVPRALEQRIEGRFHAATGALQKRLDEAKRKVQQAEQGALYEKLRHCQAIEQALVGGSAETPVTLEQWQAIPPLASDIERVLRKRFDSALLALQNKDQRYASELEKNRPVLLQSLLRYEIVAGLESPPELSRERLQMQVAVLQSTLKMGSSNNKHDALLDLCKLPALADEAAGKRLQALLGKLNRA
ncbi:MAG TPA: DUF349 domain-containing protein [Burkholderiaceae bacterium]